MGASFRERTSSMVVSAIDVFLGRLLYTTHAHPWDTQTDGARVSHLSKERATPFWIVLPAIC